MSLVSLACKLAPRMHPHTSLNYCVLQMSGAALKEGLILFSLNSISCSLLLAFPNCLSFKTVLNQEVSHCAPQTGLSPGPPTPAASYVVQVLHTIAFLSHSHPSMSFYLYQKTLPSSPFAKLPQVHLRMPRNSVLGMGEAKPIVSRKLESSGGTIGDVWNIYSVCGV